MMKKLLLLLFLAGCTVQRPVVQDRHLNTPFHPINVGTVPNDGTGDPLRTAFIQVNTTNAATLDSLLNKYTKLAARNLVNDSLLQRLSDAVPGVAVADTNSTIATKHDLVSFAGSGSGIGMYELKGIVGTTTGIPVHADSLIINTDFITHPHPLLYRDGIMEYLNSGVNNTQGPGYVFNSTTGTIIARPHFETGERLVVHAFDPIIWHSLSPQGGAGAGGGTGASPLLTDMQYYWKLDEVSGTTVNESTDGDFTGTTNAAVNQTGKLGVAETFTRASEQFISFASGIGCPGTSDFTIAAWIYMPAIAGVNYGIMGKWGDYPYYYMSVNTANRLKGVINLAGANVAVYSTNTLSTSTWYHVALVADRSDAIKLYVNGVLQDYVGDDGHGDISANVAVSIGNNNAVFAIGRIGDYLSGYNFGGTIDEVFVSFRVMSAAELLELYNSGNGLAYPFE